MCLKPPPFTFYKILAVLASSVTHVLPPSAQTRALRVNLKTYETMIFTSFNIQLITALFILSAIVIPIALYKRSKKVRYRLIETCPNKDIVKYNESGIGNFVLYYVPQVRLEGRWFFIGKNGSARLNSGHYFLDIQDAIELIDDFSAEGNLTIPSNRKLNKNEKQIIVE